MAEERIVVVGGGIAGVSAVRTLVESGAGDRTVLINGESYLPYKRTKLSKHIADGKNADEFSLESEAWYAEHGVTLLSDVTVTAIDRESMQVTLSDGTTQKYGRLILATGADPRYPSVVAEEGREFALLVRNQADIDLLRKSVKSARKVLVVGMGVLGVEVAAQLKKMKKQVTLAGATPLLMPRHLNPQAAEMLEGVLRAQDIRLWFQEEVLRIERRRKGGFSVHLLHDNSRFDAVVFCVGIAPRVDLARSSGLDVDRGVLVNEYLQTSDPAILAAGDCAQHADGTVTDLWHAAEHQGALAARRALGQEVSYDGLLFRLKCEVFDSYFFSINKPADILAAQTDEFQDGTLYQCFYYEDDALSGVIMVNDKERAKEYQQAVRERWTRERVLEHFDRT